MPLQEKLYSSWTILVNRVIDSGQEGRVRSQEGIDDEFLVKYLLSYLIPDCNSPQDLLPYLRPLEECHSQLSYITKRGLIKPGQVDQYFSFPLIRSVDTHRGRISPSGDMLNIFFRKMGVKVPEFYEVVRTNLAGIKVTLGSGWSEDNSSYVNVYLRKNRIDQLFQPRYQHSR